MLILKFFLLVDVDKSCNDFARLIDDLVVSDLDLDGAMRELLELDLTIHHLQGVLELSFVSSLLRKHSKKNLFIY